MSTSTSSSVVVIEAKGADSSTTATVCAKCKLSIEHPSSDDKNDDDPDPEKLLIQCDCCSSWYHSNCVNLEEYEIDDIDRYHCDECTPKNGPSIEKPVRNYHRNDCAELDSKDKPVQSGTFEFVRNLRKREFSDLSSIVNTLENGHKLTYTYLESTSFDKPILVNNVDGLNIGIPNVTNVDELQLLINDDDYLIDVIDVQRQWTYKMKFQKFLEFYRQKTRKRIYNLISMEFSSTNLSDHVKLPKIVEQLSWVNQYWPTKIDNATLVDGKPMNLTFAGDHANFRPEVAKFCLLSMRDSYTDFHVDFGGSSVWYHVIWGEKLFYLIEPTESNLALYDEWARSANKNDKFFADEMGGGKCYVCKLTAGQTFFIPTGWIHAVLTVQDSCVLGGNFLHSFNIPLQLKIYEMELNVSTYEKFMFPNFELLHWYAAYNFLDHLNELNEEKTCIKRYLINGIRALIAGLKIWLERGKARKPNEKKYVDKIESLTCLQLIKKLEKALKVNEKLQKEQKMKRSLRISTYANRKRALSGASRLGQHQQSLNANRNTSDEQQHISNQQQKPKLKIVFSKSNLTGQSSEEKQFLLKKSPVKDQSIRTQANLTTVSAGFTPGSSCNYMKDFSESSSLLNSFTEINRRLLQTMAKPSPSVSLVPLFSDNEISNHQQRVQRHQQPGFGTTGKLKQLIIDGQNRSGIKTNSTAAVNMGMTSPTPKKLGFSLFEMQDGNLSPLVIDTDRGLSDEKSLLSGGDNKKRDKTKDKDVNILLPSEQLKPVNKLKIKVPIVKKVQKLLVSSAKLPELVDQKKPIIAKPKPTERQNQEDEDSVLPKKQKLQEPPPEGNPQKSDDQPKQQQQQSKDVLHLNSIFGVSKRGRVQKMNKTLSERVEFVPGLGHCREDDEFVYPSLSDTEDSEQTWTPVKKAKVVADDLEKLLTKKKKRVKIHESHHHNQKDESSSAIDKHEFRDNKNLHNESAINKAANVVKMKKKQMTVKQRLALKLKLHKMTNIF